MSFGGFELFDEVSSYINTENLKSLAGGNLSSYGQMTADQIYGLATGQSNLASLLRISMAGHGFIVDTVTRERLIFHYNVIPRESGGAEYTVHQTLGRAVPHFHYKGGRERTLDLPITFTMKEKSRADIRKAVRWLQSLAYPDYKGIDAEIDLAPHPVMVVQGKMYSKDVWIVRNFDIEWGDSLDPITQLPSEVTVHLTLTEISKRGRSHSEVLRL